MVLALNASGQRHDGDVEAAFGFEIVDDRAHRLAAGDGDDVAVAQRFQQLVGGGAAHLVGGETADGERLAAVM